MIPKKDLIEYIPEYIREVKDFKYLMSLFTEISHHMVDYLNDFEHQFLIEKCNIETLKKWEKCYGIVSKSNKDIESRKFKVLSRMREKIPFTIKSLKEYLDIMLGQNNYYLNIDNSKFLLDVHISLLHKDKVADIKECFSRMLPCNIIFYISLIYNYYGFFSSKEFTHEQMQKFTHHQLREEKISG